MWRSKRGIVINVKRLSELLGVTVVPVVARSGKGCEELLTTLKENDKKRKSHSLFHMVYKWMKELEK